MAVINKMYEYFGKGDTDSIKAEIYAPDITWNFPGHSPLAGTKNGADECVAFLGALIASGANVDNVSFGTIGDDKVVETHVGHGSADGRDFVFPTCAVYSIENDRIKHVQFYSADQHGVDDFLWRASRLKPIPDRLA